MFNNLQETIKTLNADTKNVVNSEKAKKLKKKLLSIGLPMLILGFLGAFICFILLITSGFSAFNENGFSARVMIPFILFLPCAFVGGIGLIIASLGFKIVATSYTTNLINETVGNNCPNCGATFNSNNIFCSNCGTKVKKECPKCKHINDYKSEYCGKCGTNLD